MSSFKKLCPLVQLVPAAVVAAAVLATLPNNSPVLAAVPERLTPSAASSEAAASSVEEEEEALPKLPYEDGVYTGSSRGYGGPVKVQVTMADGVITDVQILDASHETSAFLRRAKRLLSIVLDSQTWEVDAVSEATYTSRGILGAIQNALTGEEVINPAPPKQETPTEPPVVEEFTLPSAYRDGVYTASAQGFGGPITVQVTIANDTITDIEILSHEGETTSYFSRARRVVSAMLETGTPDVDTVSGATYSSTGILNAVKSALKKAAVDSDAEEPADLPLEEPQPEQPAETEQSASSAPQYQDGTYTGTGRGPHGDVSVSVTVSGGEVTDIVVLPSADEEPTFLARVRAALKAMFTGKKPEADASSGVYSAEDLTEAVQNALQQALAASSVPEEPAAPAETPAESPADSTEASSEPQAESAASEAAAEPALAAEPKPEEES